MNYLNEFIVLPTNPWPEDIDSLADPFPRVYRYLAHVRDGMVGRPLCPAIKAVEQQNGYTIKFFPADPSVLNDSAEELRNEFLRRSPRNTYRGQELDPTVAVAAYAGPEDLSAEFATALEACRNRLRQSFLDAGLMLAHMFPSHSDPKGQNSYNSRIPMLMVRRMHEQDHVFMKVDSALEAYHRFFPKVPGVS